MKSNTKKRLIAFMLCMVLVLSSATSAFADEPQNTDSQSQAEVVTEPVADEATGDEADTTDIEIPSEKEWSVQVGNATVKVKGSANALPENAQLSVSEITSEDEVKEIEKAVEEKAVEEQFTVKNIFSYDIKFLVDGTEVQPTTPVQVSVDTPEITSSENAAVLHVDDNNVAEDMNGAVDEEGKVVFDAPHFSKYVIVQKGDSEVTVTIEHYDNTKNSKEKIYADDVLTLPVGGKINDYTKATNWDVANVTKVEKGTNGTETTTTVDTNNELSVTKDCTIKVYYTPKIKDFDGATTFYDYTVKAATDKENTYYSFNMLGEKPTTDGKKLTAGTFSQNYSQYQYKIPIGSHDANQYTGGKDVVEGIVKGLNEKGEVEFNYPEPGFFKDSDATYTVHENETRYLRKVYKDLKLGFEQKGDTYTLENVKDQKGNILKSAGADFYPLDNDRKLSYEESETAHNYFFGMRYDVSFKIGDYVGPMNYVFTGDDDLWVLLDGKLVLDLGGIHEAADGNVDIWKELEKELGKPADQLTPEEKEKERTLTVLYMERGAGNSNCKMKFTLPSASIAEVSQVPMAELNLQKVNKNNKGLQGARFTLVNNATRETQTAYSVGENGNVNFTKLRVGTYTLCEDVAPSGYIPSLDTWIVKVELDSNNTAIATLYLSDGTTPYTGKKGSYYQILNMTKEELINSSLDYNKTAKVLNWDDRTYQINITASSKVQNSTTVQEKKTGDAMLVFDLSGSMNGNMSGGGTPKAQKLGSYKDKKNELDTTKVYYYGNATSNASGTTDDYEKYYKNPMIYVENSWQYWTGSKWIAIRNNDTQTIYTWESRINALKEAAIGFVVSTAGSSPDSKIGISIFKGAKGELVNKLEKVDSNPTKMIKNIAKMTAAVGTYPAEGLDIAKDQLKKSSGTNSKYVILFSDGDPSDGAKKPAEISIEELKTEAYYIYTVGLGVTETTKEWLKGLASNAEYALTATNANELKTIFQTIQQNINHPVEIKNAEITDVIDNKFVILDNSNQPITKDAVGIKDGISVGDGKVYYDETNDRFFIKWTNQTISHSATGTDGVVTPGWSRTITVKAKDDYIGGNNVATNVKPDSKISTGYGEAILPQPKVNVKAKLTVKDKAVTIYKGDNLPDTSTVLNEMFDLTGNTSKYSVPKSSFTTEWYSDPGCTTRVTDLTADTDITYYLKVRYNAGESTAESTANTANNIAGGANHIVEAVNENDSTKPYGIYTIEVISGEIQITKKLKSKLDTDCTFNFSIKDESGKEIKNVAITIPAGSTEVKLAGKDLKNLPRGTYTISEVNSNGYVLTNYQVDETTNCRNTRNEEQESVTFKLGYETNADSNGKDVDVIKNYTYDQKSGGTVGSVTFTNVKATKDWDIVKVSTSGNQVKLQGAEFELLKNNTPTPVYIGTSNDNGKIIWKKGENTVTNLEPGEYVLRETKAPVGYVRSEETWSLSITKGGSLVSYTSGKTDSKIATSTITESDSTLHLYFKNETAYALPSAGGTGIYLYMIGGMLLMFAAVWILHKNKCKEVLGK